MKKIFSSNVSHRLWAFMIAALNAAFLVPLAAYTVMGSFMRYSGDDYCYADYVTRLGFWRDLWVSYFSVSDYNGNRYALTFLSALSDQFGPRANGVLPGLAIALWIVGMAVLIRAALKLAGLSVSGGETLLLVVVPVFFTLHEAPDLAQILYWRSGMLPYLAPLITGTFLLGVILWQAQAKKISWLVLAGVFLLAWFGGGFSETGAALQAAVLALFLLWVLQAWARRDARARQMGMSASAAMLGTLLAMLLLIVSPSNRPRLANLPPPPGWLDALRMSINYTHIFLSWSVKTLFLPNFITILIFVILAFVIYQRHSPEVHSRPRRLLVKVVLVPVLAIGLVLACCAPSAYIRSEYPELRALITARLVLVLAAACFAWFLGEGLSLWARSSQRSIPALVPLGAILLIILAIYPLGVSGNILADLPMFQRWAYFWDQRDEQIRTQKQNGMRDIEVMQIDHLIPQVGDLSPDENYWYNNCAESYYGVNAIRANQPGWDK